MATSESQQCRNLTPHIPELPSQPQRSVLSKAQVIYRKHHGLLIKGAFITVAIALLPFCFSQTSAITNDIIFNRGWEFLRLAFVGVALSYGLFSRCQVETEKEVEVEIESTQTYVSKFLQVSPVFEGDLEDGTFCDASKIQTWNSSYSRCESMIVMDEERRNRHDQILFLPVRSLKSFISKSEETTLVGDSSAGLLGTENSLLGDRIRNANRENTILLPRTDEVVLSSSIPWRSRSGRLMVKPDILHPPRNPSLGPNSGSEPESQELETPSFRNVISPSSLQSSSNPASSSISPSCSVSQNLGTASDQESEDDSVCSPMNGVRSPHNGFNSPKQKLNINLKHSESFGGSVAVKSVGSIPKFESFSSREGNGRYLDQRMAEDLMIRNRHREYVVIAKVNKENDGIENELEKNLAMRNRDGQYVMARKTVKSKEAGGLLLDRINRKTSFQPPPPPSPPKEMYEKYQRDRRIAREFVEKLKSHAKAPYIDHVDEEAGSLNDVSDDDDEDNDDDAKDDDIYSDDEAASSTESMKEFNVDEVDKKADEFIAKFRQQIRLQRPKRACNQKILNRSTEDNSTG